MYGGVNLSRYAKSKREVSKKGCVKGIQGRRDTGYARNKAMLIRFDLKIIKQYRVYVSNLRRCIKTLIIIFFENKKSDDIDLKLKISISNELITRNLIERLRTLLKKSTTCISNKRRNKHNYKILAILVISLLESETIRKEEIVSSNKEDN